MSWAEEQGRAAESSEAASQAGMAMSANKDVFGANEDRTVSLEHEAHENGAKWKRILI